MKKLIIRVYRLIRASLIAIGLIVTVGVGSLVYLAVRTANSVDSTEQTRTIAKDASVLVKLRLAGTIAQRTPRVEEVFFSQLLDEKMPIYLPELQSALRRLASDDRVKGLYVEIEHLSGDMAAFAELRKSVAAVREAGKRVHVNIATADTLTYYLASAADHITLSPVGSVTIPGPVLSLMYMGDLLRNIGVDFEVVRAGSYKSAFEPLVANGPSPETLEDYGALESSLREHIVAAVAHGRGRSEAGVAAWFRQSFFESNEALQGELVDEVGYYKQAWETFTGVGEEPGEDLHVDDEADSPEILKLHQYAGATHELDDAISSEGQKGIALIEAIGQIDVAGREADGVLAPELLRARLKWARKNDDVAAVVLRIDSPGGSALASDVMWNDVKLLADTKPVVVSMGSVAASGGYYIAAPATRILASPTTITGSIGVIAGIPSFEAFAEKYGINFHVITQSDRADFLNPGKPAAASDLEIMERSIQHVYSAFLDRVAEGRKLPLDQVEAAAQGKVYSGQQALALGLVDEIGGLTEAFAAAKRLAGLDETLLYPVLRRSEGRFDVAGCIFGSRTLRDCLAELEAGTILRQGSATFMPKTFVHQTLLHAERTTELLRREPVLALWPNLATDNAALTSVGGF